MIAEAALHALKELALRVPRSSVMKVLPVILQALRACVQEESWPVKDAAVGALGSVLATYSFDIGQIEEDAGVDDYEKVSFLFFRVCREQLLDAIPSVRETAAVALTNICSLRGEESVRKAARAAVCAHLEAHLDRASAQKKEETSKMKASSFLPPALLANAQPQSSSAMPPPAHGSGDKKQGAEWRKGGGWGCCLDCMEVRKGSVQDAEEGCVTLLQELPVGGSKLLQVSQPVLKLIASKHPQHLTLFE